MKRPLIAYKIGLAIIGLFSLIIVLLVVLQAGAVKQDKKTYDAANKIAEKLNNDMYNRTSVPASLPDAGVAEAPDTITYHKLSEDSFRFCVDYKAASSGFSATNLQADLVTAALQYQISSDSKDPSSILYVSPTHKKGRNCQTVKPLLSSASSTSGTEFDKQIDICDQKYPATSSSNDKAYNDCVNQVYKLN